MPTQRPAPVLARLRPDLLDRTKGDLRPPVKQPDQIGGLMGGEALANLLYGGTIDNALMNVYPSESNVSGLPALDRGVLMVAEAVATMMTEANVFDGGDNELERPSIVRRPNSLYGTFEFWVMVVETVMKRGNFVAILTDFDFDGFAQQAIPVHPDAVTLDATTGLPFYFIGSNMYRWDEVVHVRANPLAGQLWGRGIVEKFRTALSTQLHESEYARASYKSGGMPSAIVQLDMPTVPPDVSASVKADWIAKHVERSPAVIGRAISVTPIGWSPKDADWVEGAKLSVAQCAHMCGLRPSDLDAAIGGATLSYGNRTDDSLQRITDSYAPKMTLVEQAWSDLLPGDVYVRGQVEALLRTSVKERFEVRQLAQAIGIETPAESRVSEKRPPAPAPTEVIP